MQVAAAIVFFIAVAALYLFLYAWAAVHITLPVSLAIIPYALAGGAAVCLGGAAMALVRGDPPAQECTPPGAPPALSATGAKATRAEAAKTAGTSRGGPRAATGPDAAWPHYFTGQAGHDLVAVLVAGGSLAGQGWRAVWRRLPSEGDHKILLAVFGWPLIVPALVAMVAATAGLATVLVLAGAVFGLMWVLAWGAGAALAGAQRGLDRAWQRVMRADASCPQCYLVTPLPTYRCPGEHLGPRGRAVPYRDNSIALHRDIRSGRRGVWLRRCACGQALPTSVLRAAGRVRPYCPRCAHRLPAEAGVATDVRVALFGAPSAGKTQLTMQAVALLLRQPERASRDARPADGASREVCAAYLAAVDDAQPPERTRGGQLPTAITIHARQGWRSTLVHLFDGAGTDLVDYRRNGEHSYLHESRSLIFVLDPFSIPQVRAQAPAELAGRVRWATHDPEDSYQCTVTRLWMHGVDVRRQRLAFVLSKADQLRRHPLGVDLPSDSAAVRDWLLERGLDNLVLAAQRDFRTVRYFACELAGPTAAASALAPLRWLLAGERMKLTVPVAAGGAG